MNDSINDWGNHPRPPPPLPPLDISRPFQQFTPPTDREAHDRQLLVAVRVDGDQVCGLGVQHEPPETRTRRHRGMSPAHRGPPTLAATLTFPNAFRWPPLVRRDGSRRSGRVPAGGEGAQPSIAPQRRRSGRGVVGRAPRGAAADLHAATPAQLVIAGVPQAHQPVLGARQEPTFGRVRRQAPQLVRVTLKTSARRASLHPRKDGPRCLAAVFCTVSDLK